MSLESVRGFMTETAPDIEIIELEMNSTTMAMSAAWGVKPGARWRRPHRARLRRAAVPRHRQARRLRDDARPRLVKAQARKATRDAENSVRRLLDLRHSSHMWIIDEALAKMNAELA